jgi:hypothetical protein
MDIAIAIELSRELVPARQLAFERTTLHGEVRPPSRTLVLSFYTVKCFNNSLAAPHSGLLRVILILCGFLSVPGPLEEREHLSYQPRATSLTWDCGVVTTFLQEVITEERNLILNERNGTE